MGRTELYPPIEPYDAGMLEVGDGNRIYWELCGNPAGKPVVMVHGGPGGGCLPGHRRQFDPEAYRIVLFDQRNCGRSTPHAVDPAVSLEANTTEHLIGDLERLREHLGIDRWQVFGGSWGSTLSLAYAQRYPDRVTELVLRGICMMRPVEVDWQWRAGGASMLYPDEWERLEAPIPPDERDDLVAAYGRRLSDPDRSVRLTAALAWSRWEASLVTLYPNPALVAAFAEPDLAVAFARIEQHYIAHNAFLEPDQLLRDAGRIRHIPGVIVHGRHDMCTPAANAWALHQVWPEADLRLVEGAGHAYDEPAVLAQLLAATDGFR
jgi:proline iminopeptidase